MYNCSYDFFFFFFDMSIQEGERIRTSDIHFIRCDPSQLGIFI
jgi:hypothetical protein